MSECAEGSSSCLHAIWPALGNVSNERHPDLQHTSESRSHPGIAGPAGPRRVVNNQKTGMWCISTLLPSQVGDRGVEPAPHLRWQNVIRDATLLRTAWEPAPLGHGQGNGGFELRPPSG